MHSSSLQTRMSCSSLSRAIGASNPALVTMSGTESIYSMPLALMAAMMLGAVKVPSAPRAAAIHRLPTPLCADALSLFGTGNWRSKKPAQGPAFQIALGSALFVVTSRRCAIGPGVVWQIGVHQPSADKRHDAFAHADIHFARRQRTIEQPRSDEGIDDRAGVGRHAIGCSGRHRTMRRDCHAFWSGSSRRRRCRCRCRRHPKTGGNPVRGSASS